MNDDFVPFVISDTFLKARKIKKRLTQKLNPRIRVRKLLSQK